MKRIRFNIPIFIAIFLLVLILFIVILACYESILKMNSDYGALLTPVIKGLANMFQFPSFLVLDTYSSDYVYFIGIFINLSFYSLLIYFSSKWVLRKLRTNNTN